ncbi:hypothetical protein RJ639_023436 [Escallonia herrerae]|uniref:Retrotransposon gag domain-containing protein n=1 Tax=Escallonia herrerae TaxID=1293975 RepID=A0AA88V203_9ASTE|nr:hypothetical protein RJ639_023436 [Escallonia herrerae]
MAEQTLSIAVLLANAILLYSAAGVHPTSLELTNECASTVWPGVVSGHGTPPLTVTIFTLEPGESASLFIPASWSGQLWARTLCSYDLTGRFNCLSGDCGTGSEECASDQTVPPVTVAKFDISGDGGVDFYGVSAARGYNLAILVVPQGDDEGTCMATACVNAPDAPSEAGGAFTTTCFAFGDPENCCNGAYAPPGTCMPSYYSSYFGSSCPWAYLYADDDGKEKNWTFACSLADYRITFCPRPSPATGNRVTPGVGTKPSSARKTKRVIVIVSVVAVMVIAILLIALKILAPEPAIGTVSAILAALGLTKSLVTEAKFDISGDGGMNFYDHSHLDPGDLHLRLTSRSSYGRKYQSTADPTYNPKDKSGNHVTRSGSYYRRDSSVEDSTDSSPAQAARVETPRRSIHRKRTPESRSQERDSWKVVPRYRSPERSRPRDEFGYPLSKAIKKANLPPNFRMPQCDLYDGTGNPGEHVYQFQTNMLLLQVSDAVMCKAFPTTLRKAAHAWFKSLQPRSIYSFGQLSDLFQRHFVSSRSRRKNSASLLNIVQEKSESLACFLGRFNTATLEIDNLDESVKYTAFLRGLRPTSKFAFSVNKSPPGNMKALLKKANKYIQVEEYLETHRGRYGEGKEEQKKRSRELTPPQGGKPTNCSKYDERRPKEPFAWENLTPSMQNHHRFFTRSRTIRLSSGRTS